TLTSNKLTTQYRAVYAIGRPKVALNMAAKLHCKVCGNMHQFYTGASGDMSLDSARRHKYRCPTTGEIEILDQSNVAWWTTIAWETTIGTPRDAVFIGPACGYRKPRPH